MSAIELEARVIPFSDVGVQQADQRRCANCDHEFQGTDRVRRLACNHFICERHQEPCGVCNYQLEDGLGARARENIHVVQRRSLRTLHNTFCIGSGLAAFGLVWLAWKSYTWV